MSSLRRLRLDRGLLIGELAEQAGVSEETITNIELGKTRSPNAKTLSKLAGALGVSAGEVDPILTAEEKDAA